MKFIAMLLMLFPLAASATDIEYLMIKMMQPKIATMKKVGNIEGMAKYIKQLEIDIREKLSTVESNANWGFLVIAVRNDGKIKAWLDSDDEVPPALSKTMTSMAETRSGFPVNDGAVVFALGYGINGAPLPTEKMPFPVEWKRTSGCNNEDCQEVDVEEVVLKSW